MLYVCGNFIGILAFIQYSNRLQMVFYIMDKYLLILPRWKNE